MSSRPAPRSTALALAAVVTLVWAVRFGPLASSAPAERVRANDAIEQAMGEMNAAVKALGKGVSEENRAAALEELARFQRAVIAAKAETPDTAAAVDEKKRAAFVADFRSTLAQALRFSCDAEIAVLDGKYKDAEGVIKNKLAGLKSAGHQKFKGDEK